MLSALFAQGERAFLVLRVLVEERGEALFADLDLDLGVVVLDLGLAPEARLGPGIERLFEDVELLVLGLAQRVHALADVDVAGRARADAAAAIAFGGADLLGRREDRGAR